MHKAICCIMRISIRSACDQSKEAFAKLQKMIEAYKIEAIAIGNGTASRETEDFLKRQTFNREVQIFIVSEQGASIYSASKIARDEFPEYDVTVRGACPLPAGLWTRWQSLSR